MNTHFVSKSIETGTSLLEECIIMIDKEFGKGYAEKHPELLGQIYVAITNLYDMYVRTTR